MPHVEWHMESHMHVEQAWPHAVACVYHTHARACDRECESRLMQFTPNIRMTPACPACVFRSPATCYRGEVGVGAVQCVFLFAARFARPRTRSRDHAAWPLLTPRHTYRSCAWHWQVATIPTTLHRVATGEAPHAHTFCCWCLCKIYTDPDLNGQAERGPSSDTT
jgi:hypothetical protein